MRDEKRDTEPLASGSGPGMPKGPCIFRGQSALWWKWIRCWSSFIPESTGKNRRSERTAGGSGDPSSLTVPSWIEKLRRLFPQVNRRESWSAMLWKSTI